VARSSRIEVRPLQADDLREIARILPQCPEAAQWIPEAGAEALVALFDGRVAGFLVGRNLGRESEILNLAVDPAYRRVGIALELLARWLQACPGPVFLEVRESNQAARAFYGANGFLEIGRRAGYYDSGGETAIVMQRSS
jgi:[ribosomal protein S18]-alanine N-acetyltransferase